MNLQDISINKVVLIGRLSRDPELRHTNSGTAICQLRVVTTESYVNREGDPGESRASHTVVVWGKRGEDMANRARTNTRVFVEGRIQNRSYENQQGETRWVTEINARTVFPLEEEGNYGQPAPSGAYGQQQGGGIRSATRWGIRPAARWVYTTPNGRSSTTTACSRTTTPSRTTTKWIPHINRRFAFNDYCPRG